MANSNLSADRVRELLSYDQKTGEFRWRFGDRNRKEGFVAGYSCKSRRGVILSLDGAQYRAHRVAWLYVNGVWPSQVIDHINGDWRDNRIENLIDVDQRNNTENRRSASTRSKSGFIGVQRNGRNSWCSLIRVQGKNHYLGTYDTPELAHESYVKAKRLLHKGNTL